MEILTMGGEYWLNFRYCSIKLWLHTLLVEIHIWNTRKLRQWDEKRDRQKQINTRLQPMVHHRKYPLLSWPRSSGSRSHKMLLSTLDIMHELSLMLLHPMVKDKMHLQENTLFDLDLGVKVIWNVAQCPLHHVIYAPAEFEVTTSKGLRCIYKKIHYLTLTLASRSYEMLLSTLDIMHELSLMLLHPMVKDKMHLQENSIFGTWPWDEGHTKCCPVRLTSCDLFSYKVWRCYV